MPLVYCRWVLKVIVYFTLVWWQLCNSWEILMVPLKVYLNGNQYFGTWDYLWSMTVIVLEFKFL